ncbi:DUF3455 domain-containing protein [Granulicella paludicola]|uniref:DUF3455 domain-containing protein n=1 Tax=Granulicella paludicola TaxID=474951 RepID=UPI0021DF9DBD|nr:DUF3455 domain-containing protein [Granulicella paludicola]
MMISALAVLALLSLPQTADSTTPPASVHARITTTGIGVQIYSCKQSAAGFAWEFQEPQATLFDATTHQPVGTHAAGPTWTWSDGSVLTGKVVQKSPSPDVNSIPWLLLETTAAGKNGALSRVTMVRRSETQAGAAPATGCDAQNVGVVIKVPYQATYTFYEPKH